MTDDAELVKETLDGGRDAFGLLVRRYHAATYALALQRVGRAAAAEEIAQDVFVLALQRLDQLKDAERFGGWLRAITLRQCGMWLRSKKRKVRTYSLPQEEMAADQSSAEHAGERREAPFDIDALIGELPERLKSAAVLCLEDELSPSAAAAVLGIKPGTLRKRLHDARAALQRRIVNKAEKELRLHLLPKGFAEKCVCRCEKAQDARTLKEVMTMARKKKNCGCGCLGPSKRETKPTRKTKPKNK